MPVGKDQQRQSPPSSWAEAVEGRLGPLQSTSLIQERYQ